MSLLASFYLISEHQTDGLIAAARAQHRALTRKRWGIFPAKVPLASDPFWDFMEAHAREMEEFPSRADPLLDLELLVPGVLGSVHPLGRELSAITGSGFIAYDLPAVEKVLGLLGKAELSDAAIQTFLEEEGRGEEFPEAVEPLLHSARHLHLWLAAVEHGHIGILSIG